MSMRQRVVDLGRRGSHWVMNVCKSVRFGEAVNN